MIVVIEAYIGRSMWYKLRGMNTSGGGVDGTVAAPAVVTAKVVDVLKMATGAGVLAAPTVVGARISAHVVS